MASQHPASLPERPARLFKYMPPDRLDFFSTRLLRFTPPLLHSTIHLTFLPSYRLASIRLTWIRQPRPRASLVAFASLCRRMPTRCLTDANCHRVWRANHMAFCAYQIASTVS